MERERNTRNKTFKKEATGRRPPNIHSTGTGDSTSLAEKQDNFVEQRAIFATVVAANLVSHARHPSYNLSP